MRRYANLALALTLFASTANAVPISWNAGAAFLTPFTPITDSYTTVGTYTETIPTGATHLVIEDCGNSSSGGAGSSIHSGGGGGGGAYSKKTFTLTSTNWGQTFTAVIGSQAPSSGIAPSSGNSPGLNTVVNNTFSTALSMSVSGGSGGLGSNPYTGGSAGAASGGDTNTAGGAGGTGGAYPGSGGVGATGTDCNGATGSSGVNGGISGPGSLGAEYFEYT